MRSLLVASVLLLGGCSMKPDAPPTTASTPPDWNGVWLSGGVEMNVDGFTPVDPKARAAPPPPVFIFSPLIPWNDTARAKVQATIAASHGEPGNRATNANGWGYPLMMVGPAPLQFVNAPGITLITNLYRDTRQIYTDGRGHQPAEEQWPATTWGDSTGHWEADTLVIETVNVRDPEIYFGIAAPFSEKARYVERLRRTGPDTIEGEMTIEDPETLTAPAQLKLTYTRSTEVERIVLDNFSNDRSGFDGEFNTIETNKKP